MSIRIKVVEHFTIGTLCVEFAPHLHIYIHCGSFLDIFKISEISFCLINHVFDHI